MLPAEEAVATAQQPRKQMTKDALPDFPLSKLRSLKLLLQITQCINFASEIINCFQHKT
jgi:hypothetical protein